MKTERATADATSGSSLPLANIPLSLQMGMNLFTGPPAYSAPVLILQSNHQVRYDGSKTLAHHIVRYGFDFNRIAIAASARQVSLAPLLSTNIGTSEEYFAAAGPFSCATPGGVMLTGASCPRNYPVEVVVIGNGLGYFSPTSGLGLPAGAFTLHRLGLYSGDIWRWKRNFTLSYGLRYVRDTGRTNSDYPAIPQLNALVPGLGNPVRQPSLAASRRNHTSTI